MIKGKIIGLLLLSVLQVRGTFAQWGVVFSGTTDYEIYDIEFLNKDTGYAVGYNTLTNKSFLLKTFDGGQDWDTLFFPAGNYAVSISFPNKDTGYIASSINTQLCVLRSIDAGNTWQSIVQNLMNGYPPMSPIHFFNGKKGIISTFWPGGGTWITEDAGVSWNYVALANGGVAYASLNHGVWAGAYEESITFSPDSLNTFVTIPVDTISLYTNGIDYAGDSMFFAFGNAQNGLDYGYVDNNYGIIYRSLNYGNSWLQFHFTGMVRINDAEITSNAIYAVGEPNTTNDQFFFKSIDGGNTWYEQGVDTNFISSTLVGALLSCLNDTICYAAGHSTIFKTTNGGGPLLGQIGFQYAGMENENSFTENDFLVYPNPAGENFTITFSNNEKVSLEIFNSFRQLIYTDSFRQSTIINSSHWQRGMYFARLSDGKNIWNQKLIKQ